jgi:hypothetical protein
LAASSQVLAVILRPLTLKVKRQLRGPPLARVLAPFDDAAAKKHIKVDLSEVKGSTSS